MTDFLIKISEKSKPNKIYNAQCSVRVQRISVRNIETTCIRINQGCIRPRGRGGGGAKGLSGHDR